jgi:4-carboxymuconolactone decarboxylase
MQSDPERRARGAQKLGEILGQSPDQVDRSLGDVAPQLATYVLETIYGEIYQSEVLDSRTRQIVTVAALATQGNAAPQLRTHIGGALRCGVTREQLVEIMMQLVPYVGVAAAINEWPPAGRFLRTPTRSRSKITDSKGVRGENGLA